MTLSPITIIVFVIFIAFAITVVVVVIVIIRQSKDNDNGQMQRATPVWKLKFLLSHLLQCQYTQITTRTRTSRHEDTRNIETKYFGTLKEKRWDTEMRKSGVNAFKSLLAIFTNSCCSHLESGKFLGRIGRIDKDWKDWQDWQQPH